VKVLDGVFYGYIEDDDLMIELDYVTLDMGRIVLVRRGRCSGFAGICGGSGVFVTVGEVSGEVFFFGKCMEYGKC
jgi:hypothetical protein